MSWLDPRKRGVALTAGLCVLTLAIMAGLVSQAPAIYRTFCRLTGYGGATQVATAAPRQVLARTIEVRFDTNVAPGAPVEFEPRERAQTLHLGETGLAFFRFRNVANAPATLVATFNVTPDKVGIYFQKLQCFCFTQQTFAPGETREMPVVYFVDPALASDPNTQEVGSITLSYTLFPAPGGGAGGPVTTGRLAGSAR